MKLLLALLITLRVDPGDSHGAMNWPPSWLDADGTLVSPVPSCIVLVRPRCEC